MQGTMKHFLIRTASFFLSLAVTVSVYGADRKVIVLPARFQDCDFSLSLESIKDMADSATMYFNDQFAQKSSFVFDCGPLVTLSEKMAYYGRNSPSRHDEFIYKALMESCLAADEFVDFSKYEGIVLLTAGISESEGAGENHIWPQQSFISEWGASLCLDGAVIDAFVTTTESSGLGTLCHEYAHNFGLQDLYDTDGTSSGGTSKALWGNLSLMDKGDKTGPLPVNFSAIELEQLGVGHCETMKAGDYTLEPLSRNKHFLKASSDTPGEYYLFECRKEEGWDKNIGCSGLFVYHIDRSSNEAGYSYYYKKILTAFERWEYNQVNCMPTFQCAELVPAKHDAESIAQVPFPQDGVSSFSSDTDPAFVFHDGSASGFVLKGIKLLENGNVRFTVSAAAVIKSIKTFQDAAIIAWEIPEESEKLTNIEIKWSLEDQIIGIRKTESGSSFTISGLVPDTEYKVSVRFCYSDGSSCSSWDFFSTKPYREGSLPYIDLNDGKRIPLRVINLPDVINSVWTLNGQVITAEDDGYYTISQNGLLKVIAETKDGNINIIEKELTQR